LNPCYLLNLLMNVIQAKSSDLIEAFYLLKTHLREMYSTGWLFWDLHFDALRNEIENEMVFIYKADYLSLGLIILSTQESREYRNAQWPFNSEKPLIVKHLIDHPTWRKYGITDHLLVFAEDYAKDHGFTSLRLNAYGNNYDLINTFTHYNYQQTGQLQTPAQQVPFYCFEKVI
jgi:GNAT superfamily N-acetyltransferase